MLVQQPYKSVNTTKRDVTGTSESNSSFLWGLMTVSWVKAIEGAKSEIYLCMQNRSRMKCPAAIDWNRNHGVGSVENIFSSKATSNPPDWEASTLLDLQGLKAAPSNFCTNKISNSPSEAGSFRSQLWCEIMWRASCLRLQLEINNVLNSWK